MQEGQGALAPATGRHAAMLTVPVGTYVEQHNQP